MFIPLDKANRLAKKGSELNNISEAGENASLIYTQHQEKIDSGVTVFAKGKDSHFLFFTMKSGQKIGLIKKKKGCLIAFNCYIN